MPKKKKKKVKAGVRPDIGIPKPSDPSVEPTFDYPEFPVELFEPQKTPLQAALERLLYGYPKPAKYGEKYANL